MNNPTQQSAGDTANLPQDDSRRKFLKAAGLLAGGALAALPFSQIARAAEHAHVQQQTRAPLANVSPAEALTLGAVAEQIYPQDDTAGARELGAVYFMDFAAGSFMAGAWPMIQAGIADLNLRAMESSGQPFDQLGFDAQTAILESIEETPFFGTVHFLTLVGCFSLPVYGGNIDQAGWAQIGFESRHAWQPPFGYYDALYDEELAS